MNSYITRFSAFQMLHKYLLTNGGTYIVVHRNSCAVKKNQPIEPHQWQIHMMEKADNSLKGSVQ